MHVSMLDSVIVGYRFLREDHTEGWHDCTLYMYSGYLLENELTDWIRHQTASARVRSGSNTKGTGSKGSGRTNKRSGNHDSKLHLVWGKRVSPIQRKDLCRCSRFSVWCVWCGDVWRAVWQEYERDARFLCAEARLLYCAIQLLLLRSDDIMIQVATSS